MSLDFAGRARFVEAAPAFACTGSVHETFPGEYGWPYGLFVPVVRSSPQTSALTEMAGT